VGKYYHKPLKFKQTIIRYDMESTNNTTQPSAESMSANWDLLTDTVTNEAPVTETKVETPAAETPAATTETPEPSKTEIKPDSATETKSESEVAKTEEKPAEAKEITEFTLDASDIKDAPKVYEQDTFQALAQELGFEVPEESFDAFKKTFTENYVPKVELDKVKQMSKDTLLTEFNPEVAAAIKMKELGVPDQFIFNPTGQYDRLLNLDDHALIREKLSNIPGVTEEEVDAKMEEYVAAGQLSNLAGYDRKLLAAERENVLQTQSQLVQQYTEQKKQAEVLAKEQSDKQFLEELNKVSDLFGIPVTKEARQVIEAKFKKGDYAEVLNPAASKVKAIMLHEFGQKMISTAVAKAEAKGKADIVAKLSDVPPKKDLGGARPTPVHEPTNNDNWNIVM
jgi:hypothetical protein